MDLEQRLELVKRNTVEVIEEAEVRKLLEAKKQSAVYCGYETSGEIHLGHLVTLTKLLDLEKAGFHVKILLADWHAWVNKKGSWDELKKYTEMNKKAMSKLGFKDPEFVVGTSF